MKAITAQHQRSIVEKFLSMGFSPEKAVRCAAQYMAALRFEDAQDQRRREAAGMAPAAATQEQVASSPLWTPPKGLAAHERLAARIAQFARVSSEQAHRQAARIARQSDAADNKGGG